MNLQDRNIEAYNDSIQIETISVPDINKSILIDIL